MALGYCQNFISSQYLVNKLMKFDQIFAYALTFTRSKLGFIIFFFFFFCENKAWQIHVNHLPSEKSNKMKVVR